MIATAVTAVGAAPVLMEVTSQMTTLLGSIGTFIEDMVGWMETLIASVTTTGNELLLLFVVVLPVSAFGLGLLKRLMAL